MCNPVLPLVQCSFNLCGCSVWLTHCFTHSLFHLLYSLLCSLTASFTASLTALRTASLALTSSLTASLAFTAARTHSAAAFHSRSHRFTHSLLYCLTLATLPNPQLTSRLRPLLATSLIRLPTHYSFIHSLIHLVPPCFHFFLFFSYSLSQCLQSSLNTSFTTHSLTSLSKKWVLTWVLQLQYVDLTSHSEVPHLRAKSIWHGPIYPPILLYMKHD